MVEKLGGIDAIRKAKQAFDMVFQSRDPFSVPFQPGIVSRAILYQSNYLFNGCPEQNEAIATAALAIGEQESYASETEGYAQDFPFENEGAYHAMVNLRRTSLVDLQGNSRRQGYVGVTEAALYSTLGMWGAITSHDNHAVVGGPPAFMTVIAERLDLEASVREFLAYHKREFERFGGNPSWVPPQMRHVYGDETATRYLMDADFSVEVLESNE